MYRLLITTFDARLIVQYQTITKMRGLVDDFHGIGLQKLDSKCKIVKIAYNIFYKWLSCLTAGCDPKQTWWSNRGVTFGMYSVGILHPMIYQTYQKLTLIFCRFNGKKKTLILCSICILIKNNRMTPCSKTWS